MPRPSPLYSFRPQRGDPHADSWDPEVIQAILDYNVPWVLAARRRQSRAELRSRIAHPSASYRMPETLRYEPASDKAGEGEYLRLLHRIRVALSMHDG